jgi:ComF family protein
MQLFVSLALEALLGVIAPPRCAACEAPVRWMAALCAECAATALPADATGEGRSFAAFVYGGAIARAIARMKYESRPDLARPLGDLLWRALAERIAHRDGLQSALVVPVPLHPVRLAERGFNQSALLGARIATYLGAPFAPRALERVRRTAQQAALERAARVANVAGAFRVRRGGVNDGATVLLVDDVTTTGATLDACEQALISAGAARVYRIVVAAAPQRVERGGPAGGSERGGAALARASSASAALGVVSAVP